MSLLLFRSSDAGARRGLFANCRQKYCHSMGLAYPFFKDCVLMWSCGCALCSFFISTPEPCTLEVSATCIVQELPSGTKINDMSGNGMVLSVVAWCAMSHLSSAALRAFLMILQVTAVLLWTLLYVEPTSKPGHDAEQGQSELSLSDCLEPEDIPVEGSRPLATATGPSLDSDSGSLGMELLLPDNVLFSAEAAEPV